MKFNLLESSILLLLLLLLQSLIPISISHSPFFPDTPHNFPNIPYDAWKSFQNFTGCHMGDHMEGLAKLKQYFYRFGYIPNSVSNFTDDFDDYLESALKTYQLNFNLTATGILDEATLQQIERPRCGVADIINGTSSMRSGRKLSNSYDFHTVAHYSFFPNSPKWPSWNRQLTYAFNPDNQLTVSVKAVFSRAFAKWAAVTPLTFTETEYYNRADITIGFFSGDHGDGELVDKDLGTLAHAFSPPNGRFHLDRDEDWVVDSDVRQSPLAAAVDLESVAVHEIGHLLGLGHSSVEDSIMYPTIKSRSRKVELARDDVEGIQVLYGSNPNYNGSTASTTTTNQERDTSDGGVHCAILWAPRVLMLVSVILLVL